METLAAAGLATNPCAEVRLRIRAKKQKVTCKNTFVLCFVFPAFPFLCVSVNCGRPDVDYNGVVYGNDWWVGSVVRYTCRSGFRLIGNSTRSCQPNGLWTPKPICLRESTQTATKQQQQ